MSVVVLLCGIPGTGKSTLANMIRTHLIPRGTDSSPGVVILSYDEIAEDYIGRLSFKQIRSEALQQLEVLLNTSTEHSALVIVDDTMHYHSMRREVHARVRDANARLIMVWAKCELATAIERDRHRRTSVGEDTVKKIHNIFEAPNPEYSWERNCIDISTESVAEIEVGIQLLLSRVRSCQVRDEVAQTVVPNHETKIQDHSPSKYLHELDSGIRKLVSHVMNDFRAAFEREGIKMPKEISKVVQDVKKEIMTAAKSRQRNLNVEDELLVGSSDEEHLLLLFGIHYFAQEFISLLGTKLNSLDAFQNGEGNTRRLHNIINRCNIWILESWPAPVIIRSRVGTGEEGYAASSGLETST